jgi:hypothetical protein
VGGVTHARELGLTGAALRAGAVPRRASDEAEVDSSPASELDEDVLPADPNLEHKHHMENDGEGSKTRSNSVQFQRNCKCRRTWTQRNPTLVLPPRVWPRQGVLWLGRQQAWLPYCMVFSKTRNQ